MLPLVTSILTAAPAVTALVGVGIDARVYRHGEATQGVSLPYVTWSAPGGEAENSLTGACADRWRVQVDCWASADNGDAQIEALGQAVRDAIEAQGHVLVAYVADDRDFATRRFRFSMAFDFINPR